MRKPVILAAVGATASFAALGAYRVIRPWYETWGTDPDETVRLLPGDELIATPTGSLTRAITIQAPEAAVWPWLVQMGFGRAGWYSYDAMDMRGKSAEGIVPEWQSIAVGGTMPTHPGGGFEIVQIEPDHTLVLYLDDEIIEREREAARASTETAKVPAGLAVSGAILGTQPAKFRATWSFVLEPVDGTSTRLIERCRVEYPDSGPMGRAAGTFMGFGVFIMMRRQLLGLKARAERLINDAPPVRVVGELPAPVGRQELVPA
jgi:hypothetical protein